MITIRVQCTCGLVIETKVGGFKSSGFSGLKEATQIHLKDCLLG